MNAGLLDDVFAALARPGRDPRDELPPPIFKTGILKIEDVKPAAPTPVAPVIKPAPAPAPTTPTAPKAPPTKPGGGGGR